MLKVSILMIQTTTDTGQAEARLLLSNCLNWKIYCDDHSSLSDTGQF